MDTAPKGAAVALERDPLISEMECMMMSPTVAKFATVQDGRVPVVANFVTTDT